MKIKLRTTAVAAVGQLEGGHERLRLWARHRIKDTPSGIDLVDVINSTHRSQRVNQKERLPPHHQQTNRHPVSTSIECAT